MVPAMGMEVSGKLHTVYETKQITERFQKREFVMEVNDNPKYPQTVLFQLTGDRCENLDSFKVGDEVRVEFSLRGREWTSPKGETKYFNSLDVWTIQGDSQRPGDVFSEDEPPPANDAPADLGSGFDDIPF